MFLKTNFSNTSQVGNEGVHQCPDDCSNLRGFDIRKCSKWEKEAVELSAFEG